MSRHCILSVFLAPEADRGVILRRGPSKWVEMISWTLSRKGDEFERGEWFHGRVYEERCDLSPNGRQFLYFADNQQEREARTAISRPPFFAAQNVWPAHDIWSGGGVFVDDGTVALNGGHSRLSGSLRVRKHSPRWAEDPGAHRLLRDGWKWRTIVRPRIGRVWKEPVLARSEGGATVTRRVRYPYEFFEIEAGGERMPAFYGWVGWDRRGRLLCARGGQIDEIRVLEQGYELVPLADFTRDAPPKRGSA